MVVIWIFCSISQARLFDEPQLATLCLDTIDKSTADAINAEGFTDIDLGMRIFFTPCVLLRHLAVGSKSVATLCVCVCRYSMCSVGERHTQHQGEPSVRSGGPLGRGGVLQTAASPDLGEQAEGSGKSAPAHPLPAHDRRRVRRRYVSWQKDRLVISVSWADQPSLSTFFMFPDVSIQLQPQKLVWYFFLCDRACPIWNIVRSGGGKSVFTLYSKPQTTGRLHWQASLLPQGGGV